MFRIVNKIAIVVPTSVLVTEIWEFHPVRVGETSPDDALCGQRLVSGQTKPWISKKFFGTSNWAYL